MRSTNTKKMLYVQDSALGLMIRVINLLRGAATLVCPALLISQKRMPVKPKWTSYAVENYSIMKILILICELYYHTSQGLF
jgi:hypothetical protein